MNDLKSQLESFWQSRAERERQMLTLLGLFLALVFIYAVLFNPAWSGREKLLAELPQKRIAHAELQSQLDEYSRLSSQANQNVEPMTRENLVAGLARKGIQSPNVSVNNDYIRVQVPKVGYANLMDWLTEVQHINRLTVDEIKLVAVSDSGEVSVQLSLRVVN